MSICDPFLEGVACPKGGCALIKLIIRLLTVTALLVLALAVPAFARADVSLPDKHHTYGDCVSDRAQAWPGPASIYTKTSDPYDPRIGVGASHPGNNVACYDPPGGEEEHPIEDV
jgi:hypothetical protein